MRINKYPSRWEDCFFFVNAPRGPRGKLGAGSRKTCVEALSLPPHVRAPIIIKISEKKIGLP